MKIFSTYMFNTCCISVYRRVEKTSVYEVVLQLYDEAWVPGLQDPDNLVHQNMTDQMLHLVSHLKMQDSYQFPTLKQNIHEFDVDFSLKSSS